MNEIKATVFDLKRFAVHDGDGIRTTVFFKGCPLRCKWCHNPEGLTGGRVLAVFDHLCTRCGACSAVCPQAVHSVSEDSHILNREKCLLCGACVSACPQKAIRIYGREATVDSLLPDLLADRPFYEESGGGVTLSGGECLLQPLFCASLLKRLKAEGISTAVDTSGAVPRSAIEAVLPFTDRFLYDIKHTDSEKHREGTGMGNEQILSNLEFLFSKGASVEIRIPLIPGYNDACMHEIGKLLQNRPTLHGVRLLPYHNYAASKYTALGLPDTLPPLCEENGISEAARILISYGIPVLE